MSMKIKLLIGLLLIPTLLKAQSEYQINSGLLVRGKVLGGFIFEDAWILNATLGFEYRISKSFSVGADFVHINEIYEKEDHYDTSNYDVYNEYAQKNPRTCLLNDIRFYLFPKKFNYSQIKPYLAAFSKIGGIRTWCVPGYVFSPDDVVRRRGTFYDLGISAGFHFQFDAGGIDFNLGYCKRFETADVEYHENDGTNRFVTNERKVQDRMACRLNLYLFLFTKNYDEE